MRLTILTVLVCTAAALDCYGVPDQHRYFCPTQGDPKEVDVKCKSDEVMTIPYAVYAYLSEIRGSCSEPNVNIASDRCKLYENFPRCNGDTVCTILAAQNLTTCTQFNSSNILHIKYSCVPILKPDVTMVLLPLMSSVQGRSLRIHSPYYPCNTPNKQLSFTCYVTATDKSELNGNLLLNLKVFAKFPKTRHGKECTQKLKFKLSDDLYIKDICSKKDSLHRDISLNYQYRAPPGNEPILTFTYSKKNTTEEGKFILQVKVLNNRGNKVELKVSCNKQESIIKTVPPHPVPPPSLPGQCVPFSIPPNTTPTHPTESTSTGREDPTCQERNILIGMIVGVFIAMFVTGIIIIFVVDIKRKREKSLNDRKIITEVPSTSVQEPLSFYAVAQAVDETKSFSESGSPLNPRPVYAAVTKGKKKDKVMEYAGSNDIMNDVDNVTVVM